MKQKSGHSTSTPAAPPASNDGLWGFAPLIVLMVGINSVFLIWQCLDRYLAPRFLFLSLSMLMVLGYGTRNWLRRANWRLSLFDGLLLGWYALNLASVSWALSWSEGVFFAQKSFLLFAGYWVFCQLLLHDEDKLMKWLSSTVLGLTWVCCAIILVQLAMAVSAKGLDNETLYAYATGVFGNKSLASNFLYFLLVLNLICANNIHKKWMLYLNISLLVLLILLLQTRTVYLALMVSALLYGVGRALVDRDFRPMALRYGLPIAGLVLAGVLFVAMHTDGSLSERLNPMTYLESATANERRFVWYKTDLLNEDHYWWGVGNGSWKFWLPSKSLQGAYRLQEKGIVFTRAHNDYLEVRSELGMVGAIWFVALFVLAAAGLAWAWKKHPQHAHEIGAVAMGLLGYCTIQYFDFPRERIEMQVVLALLLAFSAHYSNELWNKSSFSIEPIKTVFWGLLLAGLAFNIVVGYNRVMGETHAVKVAFAMAKADQNTTLRESKLARNMFHEYNDVGIPFQWYEGSALYKKGQIAESLVAFEAALALNPWSFQVVNNYATALAGLKRFSEAIEYFKKSVEINPKYDEGKFNLAYSYTQLGEFQTALDWLSKVDTMANPQTDDERKKNKSILDNKANFDQTIRGKMAGQ